MRAGVYRKYDTMRIFNIEEIKQQIKEMYGKVIPAEVARYIGMLEKKYVESDKGIRKVGTR